MANSNLPTHDVKASPPDKLKSILSAPSIKVRFEEMLGKRAPAFLSSIISAVSANKALSDCDQRSVVAAAAVAASMDLPINPSLGFAHIVPYKGNAQFQLGWKGYVQLAMRTGQYKTINLTPVLEGQIRHQDPFTGEMSFNPKASGPNQIGYLLYFKLLNGYEKFFYMTKEQCEAHGKKYSQSYKKGFGQWADNFEAMALKTVVKLGLSKYGILSLDMQKAIETDASDVTPAEKIFEELNQGAEQEAIEVQINEVQVDEVQAPELESQDAKSKFVVEKPGEMQIKLGKNPAKKIAEISEKELGDYLSWAYNQPNLGQTQKVYVANIEAFLEEKSV